MKWSEQVKLIEIDKLPFLPKEMSWTQIQTGKWDRRQKPM